MTLGERIKNERMKKNLSQAALGEYLKITQQAVGRWERNHSEPDSATLKELAALFGVSVDYLIGNDFTPEERAAGGSPTKKISITPIEDEMLYTFREIGKKHGEQAQRALITVAEKML